ncbi:hypothetical protein OTB20_19605 [Streptomyces sp. H27-H1]|uniref:hypothetical protein n=1 Tax=Streptomyces sp. H27-H1 TaxID=2996461 RepID=UPI002271ABC1|nr:hypothetical protein [Streptomyces sp. H27-H1]MCY0928364.1 hypothetical protein [Streptomyces sp. H27-H1]
MTVRPPIVGAALWSAVMKAAGHRCQCQGVCGKKHADRARKAGRCERYNGEHISKKGEVVLVATPRDPVNEGSFTEAARLPARRLIALCPTCYDAVRALFRRAEKKLQPQDDGLFGAEEFHVARAAENDAA